LAGFNVFTAISDFFTQTVPQAVASLRQAEQKAGIPVVTGPVTPGGPTVTGTSSALPAALFDGINNLLDKAEKDPRALATALRDSVEVLAAAMAVLSLIPTESNLGGPLAARLVGSLLAPVISTTYAGPLEDKLGALYPTGHVQTRLLVSMIEAGGIDDMDLVTELTASGVLDQSIQYVVKYARLKRFEAETRDDVALVKSYYDKMLAAVIQEGQDSERTIIADLKAQRKAITPKGVTVPTASTLA